MITFRCYIKNKVHFSYIQEFLRMHWPSSWQQETRTIQSIELGLWLKCHCHPVLILKDLGIIWHTGFAGFIGFAAVTV